MRACWNVAYANARARCCQPLRLNKRKFTQAPRRPATQTAGIAQELCHEPLAVSAHRADLGHHLDRH